ncbi:MAG: hypothetical protein P1P82_13040 [Bacteroidales bacterium]|nr:hypothetical protein [Bacteroidales bacterium]MDT8432730.1 hypothetical protein [Bacteroidales bacterium]
MLRKYRTEIIIILLIHTGFMVYQLFVQHYLPGSSTEYITTADNLHNAGTLYSGDLSQHIEPELYTKYSPGYPLVLLLTGLFTQSMVPLILLQLALSMLSFITMLRIFQPEGYARILATAFVLLYPAQFIYTNLVLPGILFQFLLMMAALILYKYLQKERFRLLFFYQLMIVLAIFVKPMLYPFVILNMILFLVLYYRYRQRLLIISSLVPVVFVIIYASFNQQRTSYFHVSSIHETRLVDHHLYYYLMDRQGEEEAMEITREIRANCGRETDFSKRSACLSAAATKILKEDPVSYGWFLLKGTGRFFIDPGGDQLFRFFGIESSAEKGFMHHANKSGIKGAWEYLRMQQTGMVILLLVVSVFNLLRIAGFLFFLFNRKIDLAFRLFLFFLAGFLAFASGPLGMQGSMLPLVLFFTGAAAYQYGSWLSMFSISRRA